jgi:small subunit ribosomal protein S21e
LITAKDHASVQISIGHLDESGLYNCQYLTFALCGFTRAQVLIFYVL